MWSPCRQPLDCELEWAKNEVLHKVMVALELGLTHLFCVPFTAPSCPVLAHHAVYGQSMILTKAETNSVVPNDSECTMIFGEMGNIFLFVQTDGFLHNDLYGNVLFIGAYWLSYLYMWLLDFLTYRYIYALGQFFALFSIIITIPIVAIYWHLNTSFVIL